MMLLSSKNDNSSLCYESSLLIKILKIDKFGDFSCDIDYNSRTDVFRNVISLIINQCDPRLPKGASGGHKVSASRAAQASEARLYIYMFPRQKYLYISLFHEHLILKWVNS